MIEHTTARFRSNFLPSTKVERQRERHTVLPLNKLLPELEGGAQDLPLNKLFHST